MKGNSNSTSEATEKMKPAVESARSLPRDEDKDLDDEEFGEFEGRGESLLALVRPELVNLSQHWLAALRDHALLSLPPGS